jgi:hypothetical protein
MSRPPHYPCFNHRNSIRWRIQAVKFILLQFSPWSIFLSFRSKYLPQHPVLKNPSVCVPPSKWETKFRTHTVHLAQHDPNFKWNLNQTFSENRLIMHRIIPALICTVFMWTFFSRYFEYITGFIPGVCLIWSRIAKHCMTLHSNNVWSAEAIQGNVTENCINKLIGICYSWCVRRRVVPLASWSPCLVSRYFIQLISLGRGQEYISSSGNIDGGFLFTRTLG